MVGLKLKYLFFNSAAETEIQNCWATPSCHTNFQTLKTVTGKLCVDGFTTYNGGNVAKMKSAVCKMAMLTASQVSL